MGYLIGIILGLILYCSYKYLTRRKLPPGHFSFPIIGALPQLLQSKRSLIELVKDDRQHYGDISCVQLVGMNFIFLNTPALVKEVMAMEKCGGRPPLMGRFKGEIKRRGLLDPDIGPSWKDQKRFVLKTLKDYGFGKKAEDNIKEEAKTMINFITDNINRDEDFLIKDVFNIPVVNVIWKMVANKSFAMNSKEGKRFVDILDEIFSKADPKAMVPFFGKYTSVFRRRVKLVAEMKKSFQDTIDEHKSSLGKID